MTIEIAAGTDEFYGIKARQGKRCRIHHNTIEVNFSIEMPFENDEHVIECQGQARPLLRNAESCGAVIANNRLTNIAHTDRYANPQGDARPGPLQPLKFECGVHGEFTVDGWQAGKTHIVPEGKRF